MSAAEPTPPEPGARVPRGKADWYRHAGSASIGIEMAVAIGLGTGAGIWLENNVTHWKPWTMILGFLLGCGAAAAAVVRVIMENEAQRRANAESPDPTASAKPTRSAPPDDSSGPGMESAPAPREDAHGEGSARE